MAAVPDDPLWLPAPTSSIIAAGRADLVALTGPHLTDPSFTLRAAAEYGVRDVNAPVPHGPGQDALFRDTKRTREDLMELRRKAKPANHAPAPMRRDAE